MTRVRKPFCCDPVVVKTVDVITFSSSSATNTSKRYEYEYEAAITDAFTDAQCITDAQWYLTSE